MWVAAGLIVVCALLVAPGCRRTRRTAAPLFRGTGAQWRRQYGRRAFLRLGGAVAAAGVLVYSGADAAITTWHDKDVRSSGSDRVAQAGYRLGARSWYLVWLAVAAVDAWARTGPFSRWGRANFEAMTVGLPMLWAVQRGLGAGRPSDDAPTPNWRPLHKANAASGHAFIAAVPWLNAARAVGLHRWRGAMLAGSWLSGWSRLNDRRHYLSQVWLGWFIAWQAVESAGYHGEDPAPRKGHSLEES